MKLIAAYVVVFVAAACGTAHSHDHESEEVGTSDTTTQIDTSSYDAPVPAAKPAKPSAQKPSSGQPAKPSSDTGSGDASSSDVVVVPTPACIWNEDCYTDELGSWITNSCVEGVCVQGTPAVEFGYKSTTLDPANVCVRIRRLGSDGWWHAETFPLPHTEPLETLCMSLEKDAFIDPNISPDILAATKRINFSYTLCETAAEDYLNASDQLPFPGMTLRFLPTHTKNQLYIGTYKELVGGAIWAYIKGLGSKCHFYNHPNPNVTMYVWD